MFLEEILGVKVDMFWRKLLELILKFNLGVCVVVSLIAGFFVTDKTDNLFIGLIVFIVSIIIGVISCSVLGIIVEITKHIESMDENLKAVKNIQYKSLEQPRQESNKSTPNEIKRDIYTANSSHRITDEDNTWRCKSCSTRNKNGAAYCTNCGKYKY